LLYIALHLQSPPLRVKDCSARIYTCLKHDWSEPIYTYNIPTDHNQCAECTSCAHSSIIFILLASYGQPWPEEELEDDDDEDDEEEELDEDEEDEELDENDEDEEDEELDENDEDEEIFMTFRPGSTVASALPGLFRFFIGLSSPSRSCRGSLGTNSSWSASIVRVWLPSRSGRSGDHLS
jgi:hypothetical protein